MNVLQHDPQDRVRVLDESGTVIGEVPDIDDETFVEMYRYMHLARHFNTRTVSLQRQGQIGTYPSLSGQEDAQIGSAIVLDEQDWVIPSYREHDASLLRGFPLKQTLLYWMSHEKDDEMPEGVNLFPPAIPIASQIPHATNAAWAKKFRDEDDTAIICYFGDDATSEDDFHEGLNFTDVLDTPNIFFCNNSQQAISIPRERQTASETLAQKTTACGIDGVRVDGMGPLTIYSVTKAALDKAKDPGEGEGHSTLIETIQYRFGAHTIVDDPTVYRDDEGIEKWKTRDPIPRLGVFLRETGRIDDEGVEATGEGVKGRIAGVIEAAESGPRPDPNEIFDHVYAERTPGVQTQCEEFEAPRGRFGGEGFLRE